MTEVKNLIAQIREYENHATYARKTNEKELPNLKYLVRDIDAFGFGDEDLDLKRRLEKVAEKILELEVMGITSKILEEYRKEINDIKDTLIQRYKDRMEAYAERRSYF